MTEVVFNDMLHTWQNFYFMTGGASAGLIGLMFVALSLGMHLVSTKSLNQFHVFVVPSILYFVSALLLSCVMLVPFYTPLSLALVLGLGGLYGLARSYHFVSQLIRIAKMYHDFTLGDWLAQIIAPFSAYLLILTAALCFVFNQESLALNVMWVAEILLLLSAISNTWSLVIWIVSQAAPDAAQNVSSEKTE